MLLPTINREKRGHYVFPDEYPPMSRDVFTVAAFRSDGNMALREINVHISFSNP